MMLVCFKRKCMGVYEPITGLPIIIDRVIFDFTMSFQSVVKLCGNSQFDPLKASLLILKRSILPYTVLSDNVSA